MVGLIRRHRQNPETYLTIFTSDLFQETQFSWSLQNMLQCALVFADVCFETVLYLRFKLDKYIPFQFNQFESKEDCTCVNHEFIRYSP